MPDLAGLEGRCDTTPRSLRALCGREGPSVELSRDRREVSQKV